MDGSRLGIQRWLSGRQFIVWYDPVLATMKVKPGDHLNIAIIYTTLSLYIPRLELFEQNAKKGMKIIVHCMYIVAAYITEKINRYRSISRA